jgi:RNA polymerase sigma factor (sigma-70 family)
MPNQADLDHDWALLVAQLSARLAWELSADDCERYSTALASYLPQGATPDQVQRTCRHYHEDHQLFVALSDTANPEANQIWAQWLDQARAILAAHGFTRLHDGSVDLHDLAQMAITELVRALPTFRFQSSLKTWAYQVIVNTARRWLRDQRAKKRPQQCASLEQLPAWDQPLPEGEQPEALVNQLQVVALVRAILADADDTRLVRIFFLRHLHDRSAEEIGQLFALHPSRVRALLQQARTLLAQHSELQRWYSA